MKPKGKVILEWTSNFAYAIGLLVTDGSLSKDGRHIILTSKDKEQIINFQRCLGINDKISITSSGNQSEKKYFRIQFSDVLFYRFLCSIGLMSQKTKIINEVNIPREYFFDFLRGHFDGDGSFYSYWDKRWKSSFMYYIVFMSASREHLEWLRSQLDSRLSLKGHFSARSKKNVYLLRYAKKDSLKIIRKIYDSSDAVYLNRKHLKIINAFDMIGEQL